MVFCKTNKTYTISEFMSLHRDTESNEIVLMESLLEHIKNNKYSYEKLVLVTALFIHFNVNLIYAKDFGTGLNNVGSQILDLLMAFGKWGCISFGVKDTIVTIAKNI